MILAISNQKGGVAKTTTSIAMGNALKIRNKKVLVIDLDPQGNLTEAVNADNLKHPTIYEVLKGSVPIGEAIQCLDVFDVIPANIMLAGAEQEFNHTGKEYQLKEQLEKISALYDYIIIDTPPSLGILTVNAFTASNEVLIPATSSIFSTAGIVQLHNTIKNVKKYCNPHLKINGILVTRHNPRANIHASVLNLTEEISQHIETHIYDTFIRNSVVVEESQAMHKSLYDYPKNNVANDYKSFVNEFLRKEGQTHE